MGRPNVLTKDWLMAHGITNITKDGHVFKGDFELSTYIQKKKSRYGCYCNRAFLMYDHDRYIADKERGKTCMGQCMVVLSRAIWAWYHDICPANMDVDHINNNSLDDRLDNYQLLTRKENLAKRRHCHLNQYEASYRK